MLRCVVLDDEPLAREVLQGYLGRLDYVAPVALFGTAGEAMAYLKTHKAEVLFLDIEMPGMNGIDFLQALADPPVTVFTTAYRHYAFEGFELGVIDFLLKPFSYSRFLQAIERVRDFYVQRDALATLEDTGEESVLAKSLEDGPEAGRVPAERGASRTTFIFVKSGLQRIKLFFEDVLYIQGLKDYAIIYTTKDKIVLKGSVKAMQDIFPPSRFLRVHKSFIVAVSRISHVESNRLLLDGNAVPVGRSYKEEVSKALLRQ